MIFPTRQTFVRRLFVFQTGIIIGSLRTVEVFPVVAWVVAENMDHTSAVRRLEYGSFSLTSVRGVYGLGGYLLDLHNSSDDTPLVLSLMLQ